MEDNIILPLLVLAIRAGTPLIIAATGEILSQKSGVFNLGIEGIITMGALSAFAVTFYTQNPWFGVCAAFLTGAIMTIPHAYYSISRRGEQTISGFLLFRFGIVLAGFLGMNLGPDGSSLSGKVAESFPRINVLGLAEVPVIGEIFFNHEMLLYLGFLLAVLVWLLLEKTRLGLDIRVVGHDAKVAYERGIDVRKVRYLCSITGGGLVGLAGSYLSLAYSPGYVDSISGGRGWIVVALVICAGWDPLKAIVLAIVFGMVSAAQYHVSVDSNLAATLLEMAPFFFPLFLWVLSSKVPSWKRGLRSPMSLGDPIPQEV